MDLQASLLLLKLTSRIYYIRLLFHMSISLQLESLWKTAVLIYFQDEQMESGPFVKHLFLSF